MVNSFLTSLFHVLPSLNLSASDASALTVELTISQIVAVSGSVLSSMVSVIAILKGVVPLHSQLAILLADFQGKHGQAGVMTRLSELEMAHIRLNTRVETSVIPTLETISSSVESIREGK